MVSDDGEAMEDRSADVSELVYELSDRSFTLARAVARGEILDADNERDALALREHLESLGRSLDGGHDPSLRSAISEALVDLNYALSGGIAPLSLRLDSIIRTGPADDPTD